MSANVCGWMNDWFYHQISYNAPLWMWWCHSLTFTNPSTSGQSQLTASFHHHHDSHHHFMPLVSTHIRRGAAALLTPGLRLRGEGWITEESNSFGSADRKKLKNWANCCLWCWNMFNSTYRSRSVFKPQCCWGQDVSQTVETQQRHIFKKEGCLVAR